jgi:hypothetical protein
MKIKKDLLVEINKIENKKVENIVIKRLKSCCEVIILIKFKGIRNPITYTIDLFNNYNDNLLFINDDDENNLKKIFDCNDKKLLINKIYDFLENDDVIPFIDSLIEYQSDLYDKIHH